MSQDSAHYEIKNANDILVNSYENLSEIKTPSNKNGLIFSESKSINDKYLTNASLT